VIGTNTSALSITEMAGLLRNPARVAGMHFFNPVHKMKLVEIVRALESSAETLATIEQVAARMGKETVLVRESPGFITTRVNASIGNEAFYMLLEGVASARDIDKALKLGLNHPMGPFELVDLVGLDTRLSILEYLHRSMGEKYRPCPLLAQYVKAGRLGLIDISDRIATITINRPEVRNALDRATVGEIRSALADLESTADVGAIILTGAGDQVFVAGADIRQMRERRRDDGLAAINSSVFSVVERCTKPTIAAVNGHALGGGCELALACDLRVAADHAKFGQPEVGLGIIPAAGATQRLPRVIGLGRATQMILTGDPIDARTALEWGLVSAVAPYPELMAAARQLAGRVIARGPLAVRLAKVALAASSRVDLDSGLLIETLAQAICFESDDKREGTTAFLEKRAPKFTGR
jgi:enoyl-CoA hydratase